ncbi:MAG: DMT family transporter, partial [Deltaproteobacteria bacterium]|nr:DMT family transporter [Deltaproteobacteria bacterium]
LVILAGVMVLLMEPALGNSHEGNLLALTAGLGFAFTQLGISRARIPAISAVCLANLGASVVAFALKPEVFVGISLPAQEWVSILYLGAGQIGLGMLLFALAMRRIPVAQAAVLSVLEPIFNPLWVFLVVGESPTHFGLVGWGVILVGILLDVLLRRKGSLAGPTQVKTESSV